MLQEVKVNKSALFFVDTSGVSNCILYSFIIPPVIKLKGWGGGGGILESIVCVSICPCV